MTPVEITPKARVVPHGFRYSYRPNTLTRIGNRVVVLFDDDSESAGCIRGHRFHQPLDHHERHDIGIAFDDAPECTFWYDPGLITFRQEEYEVRSDSSSDEDDVIDENTMWRLMAREQNTLIVDGVSRGIDTLMDLTYVSGQSFAIVESSFVDETATSTPHDDQPVVHVRVQTSRGPRHCLPHHLASLVPLNLCAPEQQVPVVILQQVSVRPDCRNKRLCTRFLQRVVDIATRRGYNLLVQAVMSQTLVHILKRLHFHSIQPPAEEMGSDFGHCTRGPIPMHWDLHHTVVLQASEDGTLPNFDLQGDRFQDVQFCAREASGRSRIFRVSDIAAVRTILRDDPSVDPLSLFPPRAYAGTTTDFLPWMVCNGYTLKNSVMDSKLACPTRYRVEAVIVHLALHARDRRPDVVVDRHVATHGESQIVSTMRSTVGGTPVMLPCLASTASPTISLDTLVIVTRLRVYPNGRRNTRGLSVRRVEKQYALRPTLATSMPVWRNSLSKLARYWKISVDDLTSAPRVEIE